MLMLYNLLLFVLSSTFIIQCHGAKNNILNISMGVANARTVLACGLFIRIYPSFDLKQIILCPSVSVQENIQLFNMSISKS